MIHVSSVQVQALGTCSHFLVKPSSVQPAGQRTQMVSDVRNQWYRGSALQAVGATIMQLIIVLLVIENAGRQSAVARQPIQAIFPLKQQQVHTKDQVISQ